MACYPKTAAATFVGARHRQYRAWEADSIWSCSDLWLGTDNGFDFLRELRKSLEIPCIMMTAQDDVTDKIVGLELGADDYLFKPVNLRELLARMRALLRRAEPQKVVPGFPAMTACRSATPAPGGSIRHGAICLRPMDRRCRLRPPNAIC